MDLYTLDDGERNANARDHRVPSSQAVLRPVRPVAIAQAPAAAPTASAQPGYAQPNGYAPPGYMVPGPGGYMVPGPGYGPQGYGPGYAPGWGRPSWGGQGWQGGWQGPYGSPYGMPYGAPWGGPTMGQTFASGIGSLIEVGTSLVAAFQALPVAPNADESLDLANLTDYQRRLAEHAKGDERLRTFGSAGGKVVDLAVRLLLNPSTTAPRWY
jgi:hypothetical protein